MLAIAISAVLLALDSPNPNVKPEWLDPVIAILDPAFLLLFGFEFVVKWFAWGFYGHATAYMSDSYNVVSNRHAPPCPNPTPECKPA